MLQCFCVQELVKFVDELIYLYKLHGRCTTWRQYHTEFVYFVQTTADLICCPCLIIITVLCFSLMVEYPHSLSELFDSALNSSDIIWTFQELSINIKRQICQELSQIISERGQLWNPRENQVLLCVRNPKERIYPCSFVNPLKPHGIYSSCSTRLTVQNTLFCPHSVVTFVSFVWILEKTVIISLYRINWYACRNDGSVYCAVRTESLYIIRFNLSL